MKTAVNLATQIEEALLRRNDILENFSSRRPANLRILREILSDFLIGGRLLALGRGACSTDAQHRLRRIVHPVIVGKRASRARPLCGDAAMAQHHLSPEDIVMGFGPPEGDPEVWTATRFGT